jgi:hypothetical protein
LHRLVLLGLFALSQKLLLVVDSGFLPSRCNMFRNIYRGMNTGTCVKARNLRGMRYTKLQKMVLTACGAKLGEGKMQGVKINKEKCKHYSKQHSTRNPTSRRGTQHRASTVLRGHLQSRCHNEQKSITIRGSSEGRKGIGNSDWKSSFRLEAPRRTAFGSPGPPRPFQYPPKVQNSFEHKIVFAQFVLPRTAR